MFENKVFSKIFRPRREEQLSNLNYYMKRNFVN